MPTPQAFIVFCHLKEIEPETSNNPKKLNNSNKPNNTKHYTCQAAVWTDEYKNCYNLLEPYFKKQGKQLVLVDKFYTSVDWLKQHGHDQKAIDLANKVDAQTPVALGEIITVGSTKTNESKVPQSYLSITEHKIPELSDQSSKPSWEREWIVPELKEMLFKQKGKDKTLRTYFIVDATLRKNITKVFDLDTLDEVPIRCLFKGKAAEDLAEAAPYLIDMTLSEEALDRAGPKKLDSMVSSQRERRKLRMSKIKRNYSAKLKAQVALAALREEASIAELSSQYGIHVKVIYRWKQEALSSIEAGFASKLETAYKDHQTEVKELHAKIGQLIVERDFLDQASSVLQSGGVKK